MEDWRSLPFGESASRVADMARCKGRCLLDLGGERLNGRCIDAAASPEEQAARIMARAQSTAYQGCKHDNKGAVKVPQEISE